MLEEDAGTGVDEDTLFHLETLLVIATSDSEDVTFVGIIVHHLAGDLLSHSPVVEGSAVNHRVKLEMSVLNLFWRNGR